MKHLTNNTPKKTNKHPSPHLTNLTSQPTSLRFPTERWRVCSPWRWPRCSAQTNLGGGVGWLVAVAGDEAWKTMTFCYGFGFCLGLVGFCYGFGANKKLGLPRMIGFVVFQDVDFLCRFCSLRVRETFWYNLDMSYKSQSTKPLWTPQPAHPATSLPELNGHSLTTWNAKTVWGSCKWLARS